MSRYIDADKIPYVISEDGCLDDFAYRYDINEVPTADVVEVVRCKDCKFNVANMEIDENDGTDYSGEDIVCSYFMTDGLEPNDYCSYGERSEE